MTKYCRFVPCFVGEGALAVSLVAKLFFDNVVTFFSVISDRDSRFTKPFSGSCGLCW